jgi:predicted nucleic acid-binding protein
VTTYVDTSILAAYYCPEPISLLAERTLRSLTSPAISDLTLVELTSAVSRKIREKTLSREEGARILTQFETHLEEGYYRVLPVRTRDYRVARSWLAQLQGTLRTLDALHLAVAESSGASTLTADKRLAAEAQALGLSVKLLAATRSR